MKKLVIAEKPSVAKDYAAVLGANNKQNGYLEGNEYIISWSFGHLCELKSPDEYDPEWKKWSMQTLPMVPSPFEIKSNGDPGAKAQLAVIKHLIKRSDVSSIVIGTDAGREGQLIAEWILRSAGNRKPVERLWVSTLTPGDIQKGFANLKSNQEYQNLYKAAQTRAEVDWLIGMNFTRAYTINKATYPQILSVGRCQTPILNLIVERDLEIENFKPEPYYEVVGQFSDANQAQSSAYRGLYHNAAGESKFKTIQEAEAVVREANGKNGFVKSVTKELKKQAAPQLFNLTNLQRALNRRHGYSAQMVLDTAQSLYETHKMLSYPRSSSRYLSTTMKSELPSMIKALNFGKFAPIVTELLKLANPQLMKNEKRFINDAEITDHHAIVVTKSNLASGYPKLTEAERNVFDEVAITFIAQFMEDYLYESTRVITEVEKHLFTTNGTTEKQAGWKEAFAILKATQQDPEEKIPAYVVQGLLVSAKPVETAKKMTKPKARHNEDTLLSVMEKLGIGTEATRASLVETLIKRKFVARVKKEIVSTELGQQFISAIETPMLRSAELTSELEKQLDAILKGKANPVEVKAQVEQMMKDAIPKLKKQTIQASTEVIKPTKAKTSIAQPSAPTKPNSPAKTSVKSTAKPSVAKSGSQELCACPRCGGSVVEREKVFSCSCGVALWKNSAERLGKKEITKTEAKQLLSKGKTSKKVKLFSQAKQKEYEAFLLFDQATNKITMQF